MLIYFKGPQVFSLKNLMSALIFIVQISFCFPFKTMGQKYNIAEVINSSPMNLKSYTVEIRVSKLRRFNRQSQKLHFVVKDESGKIMMSQMANMDCNEIPDLLLFQTDIDAKNARKFYIQQDTNEEKKVISAISTYCRFVPERIDDFAWENDKVAFRTFGPKAQKLWEDGDKEGLISSGIDCWLKRVCYPIINKWYEKDKNGGSYHVDDGEGLDNFHVGVSRGCGGTALFKNNTLYPSQNYSSWKIIANGPIRSVFELTYKPVELNGNIITETKKITIDLGSNFYRCEVSFKSATPVSKIGIGITLHDNKGTTHSNKNRGWISYWEPIEDSEIGLGVILPKDNFVNYLKKENQPEDENNLWAISSVNNNKATYYAGFGWKKGNQFTTHTEWDRYLDTFANQINTTVKVNIQ